MDFYSRIYQLDNVAFVGSLQRFIFINKLNCWIPVCFSGLINGLKYFGFTEFIRAMVNSTARIQKLYFSHNTLIFDKGRVSIVLDLNTNKAHKIYDLLASGKSDLKKVSSQHYYALKMAALFFDANLIPQVFGYAYSENLGLAHFTTELYTNHKPITFIEWKRLRLKLTQPLVDYYLQMGVFCVRWKDYKALQNHEENLLELLYQNDLNSKSNEIVELQTQVHGDFQHFNVIGGAENPRVIDWGGYSRNLFFDICYQAYFYNEIVDYLDKNTWEHVYYSPFCQKFISLLQPHLGKLTKDEIIKEIAVNFYRIENGLFIDKI